MLMKKTNGGYNPDTGKNEPAFTPLFVLPKPCNKSVMGSERQEAVFGSFRSENIVVRLQRPVQVIAEHAEVDGHKYKVMNYIPYEHKSVLYLQGVTAWL